MGWPLLFVAGMVEIGFVLALGHPGSFRRLWPTVAVFASGLLSLYLLTLAMIHLPVGTAFAIWAAMGASGATLLGIALRGEAVSPRRIAGLVLVIGGVALLKLSGG